MLRNDYLKSPALLNLWTSDIVTNYHIVDFMGMHTVYIYIIVKL